MWQPVGALHTAVPRSTSEQHPVAGPSSWVPNMDFLKTPVFGSKEWKLAEVLWLSGVLSFEFSNLSKSMQQEIEDLKYMVLA